MDIYEEREVRRLLVEGMSCSEIRKKKLGVTSAEIRAIKNHPEPFTDEERDALEQSGKCGFFCPTPEQIEQGKKRKFAEHCERKLQQCGSYISVEKQRREKISQCFFDDEDENWKEATK